MAEIRVQKEKRGLGWLWGLVALLLVALAAWWFLRQQPATDGAPADTTAPVDTTATGTLAPHRPVGALLLMPGRDVRFAYYETLPGGPNGTA